MKSNMHLRTFLMGVLAVACAGIAGAQQCPVGTGGTVSVGFQIPKATIDPNGGGTTIPVEPTPTPPPIPGGGYGGGGGSTCGSGGSPVYDTCRTYASCGADGRQTSGVADLAYYPARVDGNGNISQEPYNGPLTDFSAVRGNTDPYQAGYSGFPLIVNVTNGCYVSLAFTPGATGAFDMSANTSFGTGGEVSVSTSPGGFGNGGSGVICSYNRNGSNNLFMVPALLPGQGSGCVLEAGQTYYLNMRCSGWSWPSCNLSYTTYTGN